MQFLSARAIKEEELLLVDYLISVVDDKPDNIIVPTTVYIMNDSDMGSIRFVANEDDHIYQKDLINAEFIYVDGVPVFTLLNLNTADKSYEMDIFKGDFSSLKKFPKPQDLHSIR